MQRAVQLFSDVVRGIRWKGNDGRAPDWARVLDKVRAECRLRLVPLAAKLAAMAPILRGIAVNHPDFGLATLR